MSAKTAESKKLKVEKSKSTDKKDDKKKFSKKEKDEASSLLVEKVMTAEAICEKYGCHVQSLRGWVKNYKAEKELRDLKEENEQLKKAVTQLTVKVIELQGSVT